MVSDTTSNNRRCDVSRFESELQAVADRVVEQAESGEQIEAFVARGGETHLRIYQCDI